MVQSRFEWPVVDQGEVKFATFHRENPAVYEKLREFALAAKRAGRGHFGLRMLWERVRWYTNFETTGPVWKLNDHYCPYYARLLMRQEPELAGFFELRRAKADEEDDE
jgi:hypothetical protein